MALRVSDLCASFALVLVQISLIGVLSFYVHVSLHVGFNQSKACMTFSFAEVVLGTRIYFPRCQFELTPCFDKMVYDDGGVGGGESRVRESEGGDRIDRRMGSLFGLRRICPAEKFSGGGEWWPAAGELAGEDEWERERC
ncbi:hypothetical protein Tco_0286749 [Tanacetum coccineum]